MFNFHLQSYKFDPKVLIFTYLFLIRNYKHIAEILPCINQTPQPESHQIGVILILKSPSGEI